MDLAHGRHHSDLRERDGRQLGDLATHVHPHLQHCRLVLRTHPQHRERQADLVVGVALTLESHEALGQDGGDGLLGGGLGDAAGHSDDQRREAPSPGRGHGVQAEERVRDDDRGRGPARQLGITIRKLADEEGGGAAGQGRADEAMAVGPFPGEGDEEVPGPDQPRVDGNAGYRSFAGKHQLAAGDGGYLGGGQGDRPRPGPRLRMAGIGHLSSVAQPTALGAGCGCHPSGVASLVPGGGGPSGLGGICSVVTASVAIRRNSS